jgi:HEAT repeat protein
MKNTENIQTDISYDKLPGNLAILIAELIDDSDYKKKHEARKSLVRLGKTIIPDIHKLLKSERVLVRKEAAKVVQLIADLRSIPKLITLLEDTDFDIRWIASEGLIRIGRKSLIPLLKAICVAKSSLFIDRRAHQILSKLLYENEKEQLMTLMLSLDNYHELGETASSEAYKVLNSKFKFRA